MADGPLPDHYKALGVDKSADSAVIKSTYRKLVLKCHPDKVVDPAQKEEATEKFHLIQQAYETLVDPEKRADYEAHLKLERLRKEKAARATTSRAERTSRPEHSTAAHAPFTTTGASRHAYTTEERKPASRSYDEDHYYDSRKRDKYETYDAYPKPTASSRPRAEKESSSSSKSSKPAASDRTRSDREKTRAKDLRSDRKFAHPESESSSDEKARYEADYKRRSQEDEARKQAEASRRKTEDRRSYEDREHYSSAASAGRKLSFQEEEALRYQHKTRAQVQDEKSRPSPMRTSSRDYYGPEQPRSSHRASQREPSRPEAVRRSSAQPKQRQPSSARREAEIVDWSEDGGRRPPLFKHSSSSPANIEIPVRTVPVRSFTESTSTRDPRRSERSPPPTFQRSTTMPVGGISHVPSRRKDTTPARPSNLRENITPEHSSLERDGYPTVPSAQPPLPTKTTYYTYPVGGGVSVRPDDVTSPSSKPRTVIREPGHHHRSPSPLGRPPMGANVQESAKYTTKTAAPRPPMARTDSGRHYSPTREDRGRTTRPKLYGEVDGEYGRGRQASYTPADIKYGPMYGPEDVRWAPRGRDNDREYTDNKFPMGVAY